MTCSVSCTKIANVYAPSIYTPSNSVLQRISHPTSIATNPSTLFSCLPSVSIWNAMPLAPCSYYESFGYLNLCFLICHELALPIICHHEKD